MVWLKNVLHLSHCDIILIALFEETFASNKNYSFLTILQNGDANTGLIYRGVLINI